MPAALLIGLLALLQFVLAAAANNGTFVYALDDAYIHLDLADQIWRYGHYGLNPHHFAAPSSSILWPLLLAPFAATPVFTLMPFIYGTFAAMGATALLQRLIMASGYASYALWLTLLCALGLNLPGLALLGMEHGLHVFLTLAVALGLIFHLQGRALPWWFWSAVVLGPLVRYEGALVSGAALGLLFLRGLRRESLLAGFAMVVPLFCFSVFLLHNGQEALPSSVMVKKLRVGDNSTGFWLFLLKSVYVSLLNPASVLLLLGGLLFPLVSLLQLKRLPKDTGVQVLAALAMFLLGNLLFGRLSPWETPRYTSYALAFAVPLACWLARPHIRPALLVLLLGLASLPGLWSSLWQTHTISHAIYQQQYQMHRLVRDYWHAPIAVNDIGLVGVGNPNFVLDLVGLEEASLRRRSQSGDPAWLKNTLNERNIKLVVLYRSWFTPAERAGLEPVAELFRSQPTAFGDRSALFLTPDPGAADDIRTILRQWAVTLPNGSSLVIYDGNNKAPTDEELRHRLSKDSTP